MLFDREDMFCSCPIGQILHIESSSSKHYSNPCSTLQQQTSCRKQAEQESCQAQIQDFPIDTRRLFC